MILRPFLQNIRGSYTLEAAISVPIFLAIMIFLINLINIAMVYVAMDHAVSETAKLVAAYSYPLKYVNKASDNTGSPAITAPKAGSDITSKLITTLQKKGADLLVDTVAREIIRKKVADFYPLGNIDEHLLRFSQVKILNPSRQDEGDREVNGIPLNGEDIAIVVLYTVRLPVPFLPLREVTLSNTAVERAWFDG